MTASQCLRALAFLVLPLPASAAIYEIDFSVLGSGRITGTFEAPVGGGAVADLSVMISGVAFDIQTGGGAFAYDPAAGDFVDYIGFPSYTNARPTALCGIGACVLELYPNPGDPVPGDYLAIDADENNIDDGTKYAIKPEPVDGVVPLPASLLMLTGGLGLLAGASRRRG